MMTAAGVALALIGVIIAYLAWRGDEGDRRKGAGGESSRYASPSITPSSVAEPKSSSASRSPATVPGGGVAETSKRNPARSGDGGDGGSTSDGQGDGDGDGRRDGPVEIAQPLRYQLGASQLDDRTVTVAATTSGAAESGMSYWFILEIDWGDGNTDYYPRKDLRGDSANFDVAIPADASTDVVRTGRVYALSGSQAAKARVLLDRQSNPTGADDFFGTPPGEAKSKGVRMPY